MPLNEHDVLATLRALGSVSRFLVAFSGGLDSSVLLHVLVRHRAALGAPLAAVHVDHGLVPEAHAWTAHCRTVCAALDVPLAVVPVDATAARATLGIEAAARQARYRAFAELLATGECLLTGHQRDDQGETVLLQLLRGSGPAGLAAMPAVAPLGRGRLVRPLLYRARATLRAYAAAHGIDYLVDPMNEDLSLGRGYLRAEVLPRLAAHWPGVGETLARVARHAADAASIIAERAAEDLAAVSAASGWQVSVSGLMQLSVPRRRAVLRHWCAERGIAMPDAARLDETLRQLSSAGTDTASQVTWRGGGFRRYRDVLHLTPELPVHDPAVRLPWDTRGALVLPGELGTLGTLPGGSLSLQALRRRVEVGFRAGGLRCAPRGRAGHQTLKHLFQEAGVPTWLRDRIPLVFVDGELAAIADRWVCNGFAVADGAAGLRIAWWRPEHLEPWSVVEAGPALAAR